MNVRASTNPQIDSILQQQRRDIQQLKEAEGRLWGAAVMQNDHAHGLAILS